MPAQTALLIGADVAQLYRNLRSAGAEFPDLRLRLSDDSRALARMGFRLLRRAIPQVEPDLNLLYSGSVETEYAIAAPALSRVSAHVRRSLHAYINEQRLNYGCSPVALCVNLLRDTQSVRSQLFLRDTIITNWYKKCSLCDFWDVFRATLVEVQRLEAFWAHAVAIAADV